MSVRHVSKFLVGQIISRRAGRIPTVEVKVPRMVLDDYLLMYFNHPEKYWALEPQSLNCRVGDIVKILELPERATPDATHQVSEMIFKVGEIIDPVTGRRCRGTKFIDEEQRKLSQQLFEKDSGSILQ